MAILTQAKKAGVAISAGVILCLLPIFVCAEEKTLQLYEHKIKTIATEIYGADSVEFSTKSRLLNNRCMKPG